MAKITYVVTNPGATVCAFGRELVEVPGGCREFEISVPDTPEMRRTMERIHARHPQILVREKAAEKQAVKAVEKPAETVKTAETAKASDHKNVKNSK